MSFEMALRAREEMDNVSLVSCCNGYRMSYSPNEAVSRESDLAFEPPIVAFVPALYDAQPAS